MGEVISVLNTAQSRHSEDWRYSYT